ncbi:ATP-binding cassette domain-containing protein [Corynebacterium poyangense]|uniref:ATP-binding cassette domain-containing protein n=1 Tax=Corynebacterium poyangense TaxID=2684405 RepID=A0A7H0SLI2_9CORY|nr:ABC transporter ATP-binding protein [Corynebacterium poyangense]MBZ8177503.1 ATP-binding cassette domain-containing protein [Corynebacterium poyangense]QNQ89407.1 ATP-binding cassette domain-containing protein [Corynebacterium poyangense]
MTKHEGDTGVDVREVSVKFSGGAGVADVSLYAAPGAVTGIIGPNGSGKTTLLRAMYRHLKLDRGTVVVAEQDIARLRSSAMARLIAAVPQERHSAFGLRVYDIVAMARIPHHGSFASETIKDKEIITSALHTVGIADLRNRVFEELSGGERQRVLLARALAQQAEVLILDEPTNHLDLRHQVDLVRIIRQCRQTTVLSIHDLNVAVALCDYLYVLDSGQVAAHGRPIEVLTPELIERVFGVRAHVLGEEGGQRTIALKYS